MKVTVELTSQEEIKAFYERMFNPDKPNISIYAQPKIEPDPAPQELPKDKKKDRKPGKGKKNKKKKK